MFGENYERFLLGGSQGGGGSHLISWEMVSSPLEFGGLGIGGPRQRNEALLAKWLWHFFR